MIPPWLGNGLLPPGIHEATFNEARARFAFNARRDQLYGGFVAGCAVLVKFGCTRMYLDGSFVTDKPDPGDFDACWERNGVDETKLDAVFFDFAFGREEQKRRFGGEFFPADMREATTRRSFLELFQIDRSTDAAKGLVLIRPGA
jgi:hypothetical protein